MQQFKHLIESGAGSSSNTAMMKSLRKNSHLEDIQEVNKGDSPEKGEDAMVFKKVGSATTSEEDENDMQDPDSDEDTTEHNAIESANSADGSILIEAPMIKKGSYRGDQHSSKDHTSKRSQSFKELRNTSIEDLKEELVKSHTNLISVTMQTTE